MTRIVRGDDPYITIKNWPAKLVCFLSMVSCYCYINTFVFSFTPFAQMVCVQIQAAFITITGRGVIATLQVTTSMPISEPLSVQHFVNSGDYRSHVLDWGLLGLCQVQYRDRSTRESADRLSAQRPPKLILPHFRNACFLRSSSTSRYLTSCQGTFVGKDATLTSSVRE